MSKFADIDANRIDKNSNSRLVLDTSGKYREGNGLKWIPQQITTHINSDILLDLSFHWFDLSREHDPENTKLSGLFLR
ncbi:hypothetical protein EMIT0347P_80076 [Pseudomonas sp. IT-347P]|uniref:hypothetical protein n=1 Tax=Pseudomonas sp. IT-347P TaxID=3026458 RepID=UPI0039E049EB